MSIYSSSLRLHISKSVSITIRKFQLIPWSWWRMLILLHQISNGEKKQADPVIWYTWVFDPNWSGWLDKPLLPRKLKNRFTIRPKYLSFFWRYWRLLSIQERIAWRSLKETLNWLTDQRMITFSYYEFIPFRIGDRCRAGVAWSSWHPLSTQRHPGVGETQGGVEYQPLGCDSSVIVSEVLHDNANSQGVQCF